MAHAVANMQLPIFHPCALMEYDDTPKTFTYPDDEPARDCITGRFGQTLRG